MTLPFCNEIFLYCDEYLCNPVNYIFSYAIINYSLVNLFLMPSTLPKLLQLLFLLLVFPVLSYAQPRHSKGLNMFGVIYGLNNHTESFALSYQSYLSDKLSPKVNLEYGHVNFDVSKYKTICLNPELYYALLSNYKNLYFNAKAGLILGFETLENEVFTREEKVYFGESVGLSAELFPIQWMKVEIGAEQRFLQKSLVSKHNTRITFSLYFLIR